MADNTIANAIKFLKGEEKSLPATKTEGQVYFAYKDVGTAEKPSYTGAIYIDTPIGGTQNRIKMTANADIAEYAKKANADSQGNLITGYLRNASLTGNADSQTFTFTAPSGVKFDLKLNGVSDSQAGLVTSGDQTFPGYKTLKLRAKPSSIVGSDVENSDGWYKVATSTMNGWGNTNILYYVKNGYSSEAVGILDFEMRSNNTSIQCWACKWLVRGTGFTPDMFRVVINEMTWTLYVYQPITQYGRISITEISNIDINGGNPSYKITYYNSTIKETTEPDKKISSSDGGQVYLASKTTADGDGQNIANTYIKSLSYSNDGKQLIATRGSGDTSLKLSLPIASTTKSGIVTTDAQSFGGTKTFTTINSTKLTVTSSDGFNFSGIDTGTADAVRPVWFANNTGNGKPVINTNFTYNPATQTLSVANLSGTADRATADGDGQTITGTYLSNATINGRTLTLKAPKGKTITLTTQDTNTWRGIQNNLTSDSTTDSLSAAQGKYLKSLIDGKSNNGHNHDDRYYTEAEINSKLANYLLLTGGTLTGRLTINGDVASQPLIVRGIAGSDGKGTVDTLYLQYGANKSIALGNTGSYTISADGSQYSGNAATATNATNANSAIKLTTARKISLKGLSQGSANFDGSGDITIDDTGYGCKKYVTQDTITAPYFRIAYFATEYAYTDASMIFVIDSGYKEGGYGIVKVAFRTDENTSSCEVLWLARQGFEANQLFVKGYAPAGGTQYADLYFKATRTYQAVTIRVLSSGGRGSQSRNWTFEENAPLTAATIRTYSYTIEGCDAGITNLSYFAAKLQTPRIINGTSFNGGADITTANWGTARNIYIRDCNSTHTGTAVSVNGSDNAYLLMPSTARFTGSVGIGNGSGATLNFYTAADTIGAKIIAYNDRIEFMFA